MSAVRSRSPRQSHQIPVRSHEPRIYFAQSVRDGLIKIGVSTNIGRRMRSLQSQTGCAVQVLGSVPGTANTEKDWHDRFIDWNSHGEWFHPDISLLEAIQQALRAHRTPAWIHIPYGPQRPSLRALQIRQARLRRGVPPAPGLETTELRIVIPKYHRAILDSVAQQQGRKTAELVREIIADYLAAQPRNEVSA